MKLHSVKKYLYIFGGSISLALGVIGIFLPVLPTTPFLLLAAFCYLRGSKKMYDWLLSHKVFGPYIYNYMTYKAVTRKTKKVILTTMWLILTISTILVPILHIRIFLLASGIGVTIHILTLKTIENEDLQNLKPSFEEGAAGSGYKQPECK